MAKAPAPKNFAYQNDATVRETFADSFQVAAFDGSTMRIELTANRYNEPAPSGETSGTRVTVSRLVLTPNLAVDLYNQLSRVIGLMEKRGLISRTPPTS